MTTPRIVAALSLLAFSAACPDAPGDTSATAGPTTTSAATSGTSGLSMSATSADPTTTTSTTSPTSTTSSTGATTSDTGCSFLDCDTTDGPVCLVDGDKGFRCSCDVWSQDCPDGQKCTPWADNGGSAWNNLKCVPIMPNAGKPGDECTVEGNGVSGIDSCDESSMCWNVSMDTGKGTCVAFCKGFQDAPVCPSGTSCVIANDGVLILCLPNCDPLTQDCPNMDLCIPQPMGDSFVCVLDASGEMGVQNDPCEYSNACDPGFVCANPALATECDPMAAGCCLPFCDISNPMCTNQGAMCLPWYDMGMAPPGYENVGVCGLMQ